MGDERTRCLMQCGAVDMSGLRVLLEEGDIRYGESDVRNEAGTGKYYRIEDDVRSAEFVVTDSTTLVRALDFGSRWIDWLRELRAGHHAERRRSSSARMKLSSREVWPPTDVFSSARRIR